MTTVTAEGLTKRYGPVVAVDDLGFTLTSGAVTGFLGPNGAGKSTTMQMMLGLAHPTSGRATFDGQPYDELADPMHRVGAMLETSAFHPGRSGLDHLRVLAVMAGVSRRRVTDVLEQVDLSDAAHRRVGGYSLGMRQRLGLAAALLGDPDVLVLDEPMNGLDPEGIRWLRGLLRALADEGRTVMVSSHVLSELETVVDDVLIIANGRLVTHQPADHTTDLETLFLDLTTRGRDGKDRHVNAPAR